MSDIERLREIAAKATPGPWRKSLFEGDDGTPHIGDFGWTVYGCPAGETEDSEQGRADADYIAEADPSTVLALLDRLEAAEAAVERVRALADEWATEGASLIRSAYSGRDVHEGQTFERCAEDTRRLLGIHRARQPRRREGRA